MLVPPYSNYWALKLDDASLLANVIEFSSCYAFCNSIRRREPLLLEKPLLLVPDLLNIGYGG